MPKVRKAVIPVAGLGTRLYPASAAIPKAFLPLVDRDGLAKPLIQIVGEEAIESGIEQICIVTQPGEERWYRDYFRGMGQDLQRRFHGKEWAILESEKLQAFGQRLHFAEQPTADGFGHAVYQARDFVDGEPFLLLLGDHIFLSATKDRCARQLLSVFEELDVDAMTGVQVTQEQHLHLFGTLRGLPVSAERGIYKAQLILEKPSVTVAREQLATPGLPLGNYLSHLGMHVFSPRIFESLEYLIANNLREKGEFQLTSAQEHLRQQAPERYYAAIVRGQRCDAGIPLGVIETQLTLALSGVHRTEICELIARTLATQVRD